MAGCPNNREPGEREYTALLALLRAGLWERPLTETDLFPLSADGWTRLFTLARQQTVTGIVYRGLHRLPEEFLPPEENMIRWVVAADCIERANRKMNRVVDKLFALLRAHHLHPVLLKGQGIARMYEHPLLREPGDIDLYFSERHERQVADRLMTERGQQWQRHADGSLSYRWEGVEVEHHSRLFDLHRPSLQPLLHRWEAEEGMREEATYAVPSPSLNLLLLNTHILKHALGKGIGLRQLCDMARACHCMHREADPAALHRICRLSGIERWNRLLSAFLTDRLGLPADDAPCRDVRLSAEPLEEIVRRGGNFGHYRNGAEQPLPLWKQKLTTSYSFFRNVGFSCRYAPGEAFWTFMHLLAGQMGLRG